MSVDENEVMIENEEIVKDLDHIGIGKSKTEVENRLQIEELNHEAISNMDMFDENTTNFGNTSLLSPKSNQTLYCLNDWHETDLP